jgi:Fur family transcriptional regulator, ferric uptake regulator
MIQYTQADTYTRSGVAAETGKGGSLEGKSLRKVGLKVTQPRMRILELLEDQRNKHLTADDIYRALVGTEEDIGLATVYRVLNQFEAAGLVVKHNFEGGQAYYELDSGKHHDHMVCVETGKVTEFMSEDIERLQEEIAAKHGYIIEDHSLVMYVRPKK